LLAFGSIVLVFKRYVVGIVLSDSAVRDRYSMGISREIFEHGLWAGERLFGIDHPIYFIGWGEI
jgi:hypothetical protein